MLETVRTHSCLHHGMMVNIYLLTMVHTDRRIQLSCHDGAQIDYNAIRALHYYQPSGRRL